MAKARKCGPGGNAEEMDGLDSLAAKFTDDGTEGAVLR